MDAEIIRIIDLPFTVNGMTVKDENGDYNIYLNARLSLESREIAYVHEVDHIKLGHFYSVESVEDKEKCLK